VRYAFVEQHRDSYPLQALCQTLHVSESGFAAWQQSEGPTKWLSDEALLKLIRQIHEETKAAYGSPRIYQELKGRGIPVGKGRVERLMRENGLRGRHKRRFKATTDSKHSLPVAPNRLEQNFTTERPDQVWTADITYVRSLVPENPMEGHIARQVKSNFLQHICESSLGSHSACIP
jgi:putative transposase